MTNSDLVTIRSICLLLCLVSPGNAAELVTQQLRMDGGVRQYAIYAPDNLQPQAPILLILHGGLGNADYTSRYGFNELADQAGFLAVYPEGTSIGRGVLKGVGVNLP